MMALTLAQWLTPALVFLIGVAITAIVVGLILWAAKRVERDREGQFVQQMQDMVKSEALPRHDSMVTGNGFQRNTPRGTKRGSTSA